MRTDIAFVVLLRSIWLLDRIRLSDAFRPSLVFARSTNDQPSRPCDNRVCVWCGTVRAPEPIDDPDSIVNHPTHPFKLWLEFEHTSPWPDPTNDFCNVGVDTLDGRSYGINVWTFKVVETLAANTVANGERERGMYLEAPDLLVKELTRPCIEYTISSLLLDSKGHLEDWLNDSIYGLEFLPPWQDAFYDESYDSKPIEDEFAAIMGFDSKERLCFVEGVHEDSGDVAISVNRDGRPMYFVVSVCPKTRKIVTDKEDFRKYCNAKMFWEERLGPDIRAYLKQHNSTDADANPNTVVP